MVGMDKQSLRDWRSRMDLTQRQAATTLDLHWRTIQEYEAGKLPIPRVVGLACRALETDAK